jgi:hypothetical protein
VAIAAIYAIVTHVMFVTELHGLHHFIVLTSQIGRPSQLRVNEEDQARHQNGSNEASFCNVIR